MAETTHDRIVRYLQDAVAAEHSFESTLKGFVEKTPKDSPAYALFEGQAKEVRGRFEQLVRRLESLGAEPSVMQGFFAEVFHSGPRIARKTNDASEHVVQSLTVAYTNAQAEQAMLLALGSSASVVGDETTATLAKMLQEEAARNASALWEEIEPAARIATGTMPYASAS